MQHPEQLNPSGLSGRRILITRSADRARPLASRLRKLGAEPLVLPLIDFERAGDQASLDAALDRLVTGDFDWLVVSSITTVRVLLEKAAGRNATVADLVPAGTKVATIGPTSRQVLEAVGLTVDVAPTGLQSAEGLLALWGEGPAKVFLPQADIAAPRLREGLAATGADVTAIIAYRTVDYPARDHLRIAAELPSAVVNSDPVQSLTFSPEEALAAVDAGTVDAIVAASPSAARRIAQLFPRLHACRFIAIGRPTAAQASQLGITVAAIAKEPTPDGIVAALESVFANEGNLP